MSQNINLNSSDWCELVFEGKNKSYGAYEMRQTSSRRHLTAFIIVVLFTGVIATIPSFLQAIKTDNTSLGQIDDEFVISTITNVEEQIPEENIIKQELAPPPPKLKESIQFTPPVITADENVEEGEEMISQDELSENRNAQVSLFTVEGSTDADAILYEDFNEHRVIVQDTDPSPIVIAEQMPQYPGGQGELMSFIANNLRYPPMAIENRIEGRVIVKFVVGKDGTVSNIQIARGIDELCDREAMRVVGMMPKWIPGMQNGNAVAVYFNLPIVFRITR